MDLAWTTATCHIVKKEEHNKKSGNGGRQGPERSNPDNL